MSTADGVRVCRTLQCDPDNRTVAEAMMHSIPTSVIRFFYASDDNPENCEDGNASDDPSETRKDQIPEDDVAEPFGDFDEEDMEDKERNTPPSGQEERNAEQPRWRRLRRPAEFRDESEGERSASEESRPGVTLLNNLAVESPQMEIQQEIWDSAKKALQERKVESDVILGKGMRGADVTEIYSPLRIAAACLEAGLVGGSSFDLRTGWDLSNPHHQKMVLQTIMKESPKLLIGSPPCTLFSNLQNLNLAVQSEQWKHEFYERRRKAEAHLVFCCKLYKLQRSLGRYYLHEHPTTATSWETECMKSMQKDLGALRVRADQCQYGLITSKNGVTAQPRSPQTFLPMCQRSPSN